MKVATHTHGEKEQLGEVLRMGDKEKDKAVRPQGKVTMGQEYNDEVVE